MACHFNGLVPLVSNHMATKLLLTFTSKNEAYQGVVPPFDPPPLPPKVGPNPLPQVPRSSQLRGEVAGSAKHFYGVLCITFTISY